MLGRDAVHVGLVGRVEMRADGEEGDFAHVGRDGEGVDAGDCAEEWFD